jgi:hypothetical protein
VGRFKTEKTFDEIACTCCLAVFGYQKTPKATDDIGMMSANNVTHNTTLSPAKKSVTYEDK